MIQTLLVKEIANRMKDPEEVGRIFFDSSNKNFDPLFPERLNLKPEDFNIDHEYCGILLLLGELDHLFPEENWDSAIHAYVLKVKEGLEKKRVASLSLFEGITGIAYALQRVSRGGSRYQKMILVLQNQILEVVRKLYLIPLEENFNAHRPSSLALYDLIRGVVGLGIYSLSIAYIPSFAKLVKDILGHLVNLSKPIKVDGQWVPGWYLPSHLQFLKEDQQKYPKGNFNLGLAHGIPGVLAFLSIALLHGVEVAGQKEAIQYISTWVKKYRQESNDCFFWGTHISFEEEIEHASIKKCSSSKRDAWCYGTIGVARSLFLAGKALRNEELKSFAFDSFCSIFNQSRQEWNLPSPTFCHGISGFLMTTWLMYQDTQSPYLYHQMELLKKILLDYYHEDYPFGFKNLEPCKNGGFVELSHFNLIEGIPGILLTLLSIDGLSTWWHAPFLIGEGK